MIVASKYFVQLSRIAALEAQAAANLRGLLTEPAARVGASAARISELELAARAGLRTLLEEMEGSGQGRDGIRELARGMADLAAAIGAAATPCLLLGRDETVPEAVRIAEILSEQVREIGLSLDSWLDFDQVVQACLKIKRLESHADRFFASAVLAYFQGSLDSIQTFKLKDVLARLEHGTDVAKDVAGMIERIAIRSV
jgi:uncharacterized protein Yka (UPF0111/DUF47 family)